MERQWARGGGSEWLFWFLSYRRLLLGIVLAGIVLLFSFRQESGASWLAAFVVFLVPAVTWGYFRFYLSGHFWPGRIFEMPSVPWKGLVIIATVIGMVAALWKIPEAQVVHHSETIEIAKRLELVNEYRRTLAQLFGGALLLIGLYATWQQISIAAKAAALDEQRFISERTDRVIGQLVSNDGRLVSAAIAELGSIAESSEEQRCRIRAVLESFVRESRSSSLAIMSVPAEETATEKKEEAPLVALAIRQLGRSNFAVCGKLDLSGVDLRGLRLEGLVLRGVLLAGSQLDDANFSNTDLSGAALGGASLKRTNFRRANLWGVTGLTRDQLREATVTEALLPDELRP